jgi:hypothetical protein
VSEAVLIAPASLELCRRSPLRDKLAGEINGWDGYLFTSKHPRDALVAKEVLNPVTSTEVTTLNEDS